MSIAINSVTNINECGGLKYLSFSPLESYKNLVHGFSTRIGGVSKGYCESLNLGFERGDDESCVWTNIGLLADAAGFNADKIAFPNQKHTNNIRVVDSYEGLGIKPDKNGYPIDGQVTDIPGVTLFAYGADCTPVYLYDDVHKAIGLCHSGWRGTVNAITCDTVSLMKQQYNTVPKDLIAVIGPSISSKAYEVGADVANEFIGKYGICVDDDSLIVKNGMRQGKYQLDLWQANYINLKNSGLSDSNIYISGICTYSERELMFSHRRDGDKRGVMAAFMAVG